MKRWLLLLAFVIFTGGCSDVDYKVQFYSGGECVRQWTSDGRVFWSGGSNSYYFYDKETLKMVTVSGEVVITVVETK